MPPQLEQDVAKFKEYVSQIPITAMTQPGEFGYDNPVDVCMDAVLSIQRKYNSFVVPRLEYFRKNYPEINSLEVLLKLIHQLGYTGFCAAWNYNHEARVKMLERLARRFLEYNSENNFMDEITGMKHWANSVSVHDYSDFGVKGIGLATFQYLRMLLGAQTVKPDVHIKKAISLALDREVNDLEAIELIEQASKELGLPATVLDHNIWRPFAKK